MDLKPCLTFRTHPFELPSRLLCPKMTMGHTVLLREAIKVRERATCLGFSDWLSCSLACRNLLSSPTEPPVAFQPDSCHRPLLTSSPVKNVTLLHICSLVVG